MKVDTLDDLRQLSAPARLFVEEEIEPNAWPDARFLYKLWLEKKGAAQAPKRADFTPMDMKPVLPYITLSDVEWGPFRLKSRLVGTAFVEAIGFEPTGKYTDEIPHTEMLIRRSQWAAYHLSPLMSVGLPLVWSPKDFKSYDTLCLPLLGDDGRADMLMFINRFHL